MFTRNIGEFIKKFDKLFGLSLRVFLLTAIVVTLLGVYIANLVYGDNSIHKLESLRQKKIAIKNEIKRLKEENAKLHKQYLEWSDARSTIEDNY